VVVIFSLRFQKRRAIKVAVVFMITVAIVVVVEIGRWLVRKYSLERSHIKDNFKYIARLFYFYATF
jgi:hypothetical protein